MNISIENFTHPIQPNPKIILSEESTDFLQRLEKLNTGYFFRPDSVLLNKLKTVDSSNLTNVLNCFFMKMIQENRIADPVKFLDRLAVVIPFAKMQQAVKSHMGDALKEAKRMSEEAKLYLQMTHGNTSLTLRARFTSLLDGIISLIESILVAFGIGDFFKPAESEIHADLKSQKIMLLLSIFSMITTMILPILGAEAGGLIIGGIFLGIAALSAIWPFIKPMPTHLPANAQNWTKKVQNGNFVVQERTESLNEIANIIKMKRHAILVGPSRVGKSLTAKAFAQAIEKGDYPELKGKVVFRINTADIIGQQASFLGGGNNILNKISAAMGRHRENILLVLDEIHMACKNNEKIADQLKPFLDENGEFPHVIGITTEEEYNNHIKDNHAFSLRFDRVDIKNTTQDETLKILCDTLLKNRSKPLIKEGALDHLYNKSSEIENAPQPATALKILNRCIHRISKTQKSPTEKKIVEISNKILLLRAQGAVNRGKQKERTQIAELERQVIELQQLLVKEQKELENLFKSKDLLDRVTIETYSSVLKISSIAQNTLNVENEKQLNLFVLLHEFLSPLLEAHITAESKRLGIQIFIDKTLINEMAHT